MRCGLRDREFRCRDRPNRSRRRRCSGTRQTVFLGVRSASRLFLMENSNLPENNVTSETATARSSRHRRHRQRLIVGIVAAVVILFGVVAYSASNSSKHTAGTYEVNGCELDPPDRATAECSDSDFEGLDLRGVYLAGADLSSANLYSSDLRGANLAGADLTNANLNFADLRGANLRYATLRRAKFTGAKLFGADLTGATLTDANWSNTTCPNGTVVYASTDPCTP